MTTEKTASLKGFVNAWSSETHKKAQASALTDHLIIESNEGQPVGYLIGYVRPDDNYELMRIVVSKKGFGYGKAAIEGLMGHAFLKNTHRFWLDVRSHNKKAILLYEDLGFVTDGILREAVKFNGSYISVQVMSVLRQDYDL